jgi:hypothetical protein
LLDLTGGSLASAENETGHLGGGAWRRKLISCGSNEVVCASSSQLCGLVGNFSLEISWRDILACGSKELEMEFF